MKISCVYVVILLAGKPEATASADLAEDQAV